MELHNYFSDLNMVVLTTSFILEGEDQITTGYHHPEDGMWVLVGKMDEDELEYKVVSLEEMIDLDKSLLSLSNMEPGYFAYRASGRDNFVMKKMLFDI